MDEHEPQTVYGEALLSGRGTLTAEGVVDRVWDVVSLTLFIAFVSVLVTVAGVLVATFVWYWRLIYAFVAVSLVVGVFWIRPLRVGVIHLIRKRVPNLPN